MDKCIGKIVTWALFKDILTLFDLKFEIVTEFKSDTASDLKDWSFIIS